MDGRAKNEIRPLSAEVGVLPRVHGTGLFTRGQTQVLSACTLDTLSGESRLVDRTLKLWLKQLDAHERAQFVDSMYSVLSSVGASTLTELNADRKALMSSLKHLDPKSRDMLLKLVFLLADEGTKALFEKKDKKEKKQK